MTPQNNTLFKLRTVLAFSFALFSFQQLRSQGSPPPPKILVFSKTTAFRHASIADGNAAIKKLGEENNFLVDTTTNAAFFRDDQLINYAAVVFLSTTGNVLNDEQQAAFERYINNGGGFAGIHAAADTEYDWPWYNRLLGAYFLNHPAPQTAEIVVTDKNHPSTATLPERWQRFDEWYNFKNMVPGIRVLATLDESTYQGGVHGENHPIIWYQPLGCGRSWYTALGHTSESYREPLFLQHLLGGIQYAIGSGQGCATLPVVLDRFTAFVSGRNRVELTWGTTTEKSSDLFAVERSSDQEQYRTIGTVRAKGSPSSYTFFDQAPFGGRNFYRLRQVDHNGASQYSKTISVFVKPGFSLVVSPNPSKGLVEVSTGAEEGERVEVRVVDRSGRQVYAGLHQGPRFTVNLTKLPAGTYFVKIGTETIQLVLSK